MRVVHSRTPDRLHLIFKIRVGKGYNGQTRAKAIQEDKTEENMCWIKSNADGIQLLLDAKSVKKFLCSPRTIGWANKHSVCVLACFELFDSYFECVEPWLKSHYEPTRCLVFVMFYK